MANRNKDKNLDFGANSEFKEIPKATGWSGKLKTLFGEQEPEESHSAHTSDILKGALPAEAQKHASNLTPREQTAQSSAATILPPHTGTDSTLIGKHAAVNGNLTSKSDITIAGYLRGDIQSEGTVIVSGRVDGTVDARQIQISGGVVNGDLNGSETVSLDVTSIVIGDIHAGSAKVDGRIKGSIEAEESAVVEHNAIVHGDITARVIHVDKGAVLNGKVTIVCPDAQDEQELFALPPANEGTPDFAAEENEESPQGLDKNH